MATHANDWQTTSGREREKQVKKQRQTIAKRQATKIETKITEIKLEKLENFCKVAALTENVSNVHENAYGKSVKCEENL